MVRATTVADLISDQQQFAYLSPAPGARYVTPEHTIAIRKATVDGFTLVQHISFEVIGRKSGDHIG